MFVKIINVFCLFIFVSDVSGFNAADYCSVSCNNGFTHTACSRKNEECKPSTSCQKVIKAGLTDRERQIILDEHNKYRMNIANGKILGIAVPKAADMRQLIYNKELEYIAQCHVNICKGMYHDNCRRTSRLERVGQNLAEKFTTGPIGNLSESDTDAIYNWVNEVKDTPNHLIDKFSQTSGNVIGHYTQLAWAESDEIGCGRIVYKAKGWTTAYLACNYAEGNILTEKMYKRGTPCSRCPEGTSCSTEWPGLCDGVAVTKPPHKHKTNNPLIGFRDFHGWQTFFETIFGRQRTI